MSMLIRKSKHIVLFVLAALITQGALAHEGHGGGSLFQHDLEHAAWTFSLVALGLVLFGVYKYRSK